MDFESLLLALNGDARPTVKQLLEIVQAWRAMEHNHAGKLTMDDRADFLAAELRALLPKPRTPEGS